jgi:hypothetical protein
MADQWDKLSVDFNSTAWDYKTVKEFIGVYKGMKTGVGAYKSNLYQFETKDGLTDVWGTTSLNMEMENYLANGIIKAGDKIKIVYEGKLKNDKTGRYFHSFKVFKAK